LLVATVVAAGCISDGSTEGSSAPTAVAEPTPAPLSREETAAAFLDAWEANDWLELNDLVFDPTMDPAGRHQMTWENLQVFETSLSAEPLVIDGRRASQTVTVDVELEQLGLWSYTTQLGLVEVGGEWTVEWSPTVIHPGLVDGRSLSRRRVWPARGELVAWDGIRLRTDRPVVDIGIEPRRIEDREALLAALEAALDVDPDEVGDALDAPGVQPDWFVPVATMRSEEFPEVAAQVQPLPGVIIRDGLDRLAPTVSFARQILGTVGPITAEQLAAWGEPYDSTRIVGRSGLELVYEQALAGAPGGDIRLVDVQGALVSVLQAFPGREPVDVVTSLDFQIQTAAEAALDNVVEPAAFVAIDTSTGQIRAAVSRPFNEFARALSGVYPPGSTFKTITAAAFLGAGATSATSISCPAELFVGGFRFSNAGGFALGPVSLQTAYAASCNTAFVNVAVGLDDGVLNQAANDFGFGVSYAIGLNTGGGTIPPPIDEAEFAASAIGQGRVTASPLHMASVAAAVADGTWRPPTLVLEPERDATAEPVKFDTDVVAQLQTMMRAVVTRGTGTAVSSAGSNISGKTGSAEFGEENPPETHAWFIGFRDDLAFAVLVEGGGAGGSVAAPIASEFLATLDAVST
jgi:cell division protein FtsI/penicillin-binding protein 2